jgi:hypothetical protein
MTSKNPASSRLHLHVQVERGSEDAYFVTSVALGAVGVADGVGSWADDGVDPSEYSRGLMAHCCKALEASQGASPAVSALEFAQVRGRCPGDTSNGKAGLGALASEYTTAAASKAPGQCTAQPRLLPPQHLLSLSALAGTAAQEAAVAAAAGHLPTSAQRLSGMQAVGGELRAFPQPCILHSAS